MSSDLDPAALVRASSSRDLLRLYGALLSELTDRGVLRSRNAPAGDLAEHLAAVVYDGVLAAASEKSWDVRDSTGRTVQVKCRVQGEGRPGNFSFLRSFDFDACVFVRLDGATYDVVSAVEVPAGELQAIASYSAHVNGWRISARRPLADLPGAVDLTERFRTAMEQLP
ncbi:DUF6998 domain-containing protein [Cellulosimicrobium funkei]|uniref:DUF6998 domain-containing protein n=1 Tax=Cellulosimicrobium funkei TaxID=264251 RepID=UPI00369FE344